jgi:hypothetical protein
VLKLVWPGQFVQVSIVAGPVQVGVQTYQTSGEKSEAPHGNGIDPSVEGVAHIVVPQAAGDPLETTIAFWHRSFGGGVVDAVMFRRKSPVAQFGPETRR